jgi:2'-5' RNA ligase
MENQIRAFVCVEIPERVKEEIEKCTKSLDRSELRPVRREQLHVTVFFFAGISENQIESIKKAMDSIDTEEFEISIKGIDAFGARQPNVLFANVNDNGNLLKIYGRLKERIEVAGIRIEERPYTPHLTIARVKERDRMVVREISDIISKNKETLFGTFKCETIKLKKSMLTNEGPIYEELYLKKLGHQ